MNNLALNNQEIAIDKRKLFDNLVWLNTDETAEYLRISCNAVRMKISRGELKPHRLGRHLRFKRSDLDMLLEPPEHRRGFYGN